MEHCPLLVKFVGVGGGFQTDRWYPTQEQRDPHLILPYCCLTDEVHLIPSRDRYWLPRPAQNDPRGLSQRNIHPDVCSMVKCFTIIAVFRIPHCILSC